MYFPVKCATSDQSVELRFATEDDISRIERWKQQTQAKTPIIRDALQLADLVMRWWRYYRKDGSLASSMAEYHEFVTDNPNAEVAMCVVAVGEWFQFGPVLGVALFRRSWCNNVILDYLTANPVHREQKIKGLGCALSYFLASFSLQIEAECVWGQTTQNSVGFYQKIFQIPAMRDLLSVDSQRLQHFKQLMEQKFSLTQIVIQ